jgi:hypothetical protein
MTAWRIGASGVDAGQSDNSPDQMFCVDDDVGADRVAGRPRDARRREAIPAATPFAHDGAAASRRANAADSVI